MPQAPTTRRRDSLAHARTAAAPAAAPARACEIDPIDALLAHTSSLPAFSLSQRDHLTRAAVRCDLLGYRRIALFGAGRHTARITRQPWADHDVRVVAIIDDAPRTPSIRGMPVLTPDAFLASSTSIDAVVVSSDAHEETLFRRASEVFASRAIPVLRIYSRDEAVRRRGEDAIAVARLVDHWGVALEDARWLIANRAERHDASLPMLPPERTELHLRRYEFAAALCLNKRCLDIACGTGYGSALLADSGAATVAGIDLDPRAIEYARRRHARTNIRFDTGDAQNLAIPDASIDLITSFETIEHVPDPALAAAEFARVLSSEGTLVLSTPNDWGLTDHHVQSFTREDLERILRAHFAHIRWFIQRSDVDSLSGAAAGIAPLTEDNAAPSPAHRAETLIAVLSEPRR